MNVETIIAIKEQQELHNKQMEESSQIYEDNLARAEQNAVDKIIAAVAAE